ncbi:MAG: SusC/RagA family TonB-linked outer membrane protein, partial [bacterium]
MKRINILIMTLLFSVFSLSAVFAQVLEITGMVTEMVNGEGLPGANIAVKGTTLGTASDANGNFSIRLRNFTEATLVVSFIGYKTAEVNVTSSTSNLNISLEEDVLKTSEVIVTGLATSVKRRNLANSVGTVSAKELVPAPAQTLERAMNGKMAGITVSQNTGAPGGGIYVNLRGTSTIEGSTEPLYIVDGVIINNSAIQSGLDLVSLAAAAGSPRPQGQPTNRIADINPNDIENIEVLKGPSAAAIYGSKASNGVIIITTKQGIAGKTKIDVTQQFGFSNILREIGVRKFTPETAEALQEGGAALLAKNGNIDHENELFGETGFLNETTLSVRGGNERTQFYVGGLFQDEDSIVKHTGYQKYSAKANVNHKISDRLRISAFTTFARTESDRSITGNENRGATTLGFGLAFTPSFIDLRPQNVGGTLVFPDNPSAGSNPLHTIEVLTNNEVVYRTIGSARLNWSIIKSQQQALDFILQAGVDFFSMENKVISPPELQFERQKDLSTRGQAINGETESTNSNLYLHLSHSYSTPSNLIFRTSAGVQFENQNRNNLLVQSQGLVAGQNNADQAASSIAFQTVEKQRERGFFVQEEVDLSEKIYLTAGLRGDASSANGNTDKLFLFPKASASIRLSQYGILTSVANELKLRAAYGETGNLPGPIAKFTSLTPENVGGIVGGINPTRRGAQDLKPERSKEIEVGLDAAFFSGNAVLEFSYYRQNISDLIFINELPP